MGCRRRRLVVRVCRGGRLPSRRAGQCGRGSWPGGVRGFKTAAAHGPLAARPVCRAGRGVAS
eukprot:1953748-Alexandrium_andersonii.AAC.1